MSLHRRGRATKRAPESQTLSTRVHYVTAAVEVCARGSVIFCKSARSTAPFGLAIVPGQPRNYSGPEVGFGEITIDLLQATD